MLSVVIWAMGEPEPIECDGLWQKISGHRATKASPSIMEYNRKQKLFHKIGIGPILLPIVGFAVPVDRYLAEALSCVTYTSKGMNHSVTILKFTAWAV